VIVVLTAAEVAATKVPTAARTVLTINVSGEVVSADIATKSLRKAQATIAEHGVDGVSVLVQGKLIGERVTEAGLVAQLKIRPAAAAGAGTL
jgi:hypothetical protein